MKKIVCSLLITCILLCLTACSVNIYVPAAHKNDSQSLNSDETYDEKLASKLIGAEMDELVLKSSQGTVDDLSKRTDEYIIALLSADCEACQEAEATLLENSKKLLPLALIYRLDDFESIGLYSSANALKEDDKIYSGVESPKNKIKDTFPFESIPVFIKINNGVITEVTCGFSDSEDLLAFCMDTNLETGTPLN